jgi:uncharacterized membrane protein YvbJ
MNELIPEKTACKQCGSDIDPADKFCRHCGMPFDRSDEQSPATDVRPINSWDSRAAVLFLLFMGIGPFAIPVLWRSKHFSRRSKLALTITVVTLTIVLLWLLWVVIKQFILPLRELLDIIGR